jgi:MFS family permease
MFLAFSGSAISNYGFMVWGPTYFMRVHGLSVAEVGLLMGLGFAVLATSGVLLGGLWVDRAQRSGRVEAPIWVALRVAWMQLPFMLGAYLSSDPSVAVVLFCGGMFMGSLMGGLQGQMVQVLTPNRMRGQAGAIYIITVNILGLGLGPIATAAMTDYVFGGPDQILASLLLMLGMKEARERAATVLDA